MRKAHTLITFIGAPKKAGSETGHDTNYHLARYLDPDVSYGDTSNSTDGYQTQYICEALAHFAEVERVILLGTTVALGLHLGGINEALRKLGKRDAETVPVPSCGTTEEAWEIFTTIWNLLNRVADRDSILDITHGFRSQGFLAGAVAAFFRLTDNGDRKKHPRLVYGAFEMLGRQRLGSPVQAAPIVDLTSFIDLIAWAEAILLFERTGRAGPLAKLADPGPVDGEAQTETSTLPVGDGALSDGLKALGSALKAFGPDFETIRTGALLLGETASAPILREAVRDAIKAAHGREATLAPLIQALGRIESFVAPLVDPDLTTLAGPKARPVLAGLAQAYQATGRYPEALTTVREGFVSLLAADNAGRPGADFDKIERSKAEGRFHLMPKGDLPDNGGEALERLPKCRNDINHSGFNNDPAKGACSGTVAENASDTETEEDSDMRFKDLVTATEQMVALLQNSELADAMFRAASQAPKPPLFINLSNHPHEARSEEQRQEAYRLAGGDTILDIGIPAVPDGNTDLQPLVNDIRRKIRKLEKEHTVVCAMVQGEYTLTYALVGALQMRGIRCVAALSATRAEPFRFAGFRAYA